MQQRPGQGSEAGGESGNNCSYFLSFFASGDVRVVLTLLTQCYAPTPRPKPLRWGGVGRGAARRVVFFLSAGTRPSLTAAAAISKATCWSADLPDSHVPNQERPPLHTPTAPLSAPLKNRSCGRSKRLIKLRGSTVGRVHGQV